MSIIPQVSVYAHTLAKFNPHNTTQCVSFDIQDPVLFGASVRYNLDPFTQYDDDRIWRALEQVIIYLQALCVVFSYL